MQLDDQLRIDTPEGVSLTLNLAGLGSRIAAGLLDGLIQFVVLIIITLFATAVLAQGSLASAAGIGLASAAISIVLIGYYILFEVLNNGKTVGKLAAGIQVVRDDGSPITFAASMIRNLIRIVDWLPAAGAAGIIAIMSSSKQQRLGDMAAGTLVIRYRFPKPIVASMAPPAQPPGPRWDVSAVTQEEAALLRRLFERWTTVPAEQRTKMVETLEQRLRPKVGAATHFENAEEFLRWVLAEKVSREES